MESTEVKQLFTFGECKSIHEISEAEFTPLACGRSFYVSRPWLVAVQHARSGNVRYLWWRDQHNMLVALLPVYEEVDGGYHLFTEFLKPASESWNKQDWSPAAVIGTQAAYSTEFLIHRDLDQHSAAVVMESMLDRVSSCNPITALYLTQAGKSQLLAGGVRAGSLFTAGGNCVINVKYDTFDEYTRALGRHGRVIRRERRVFESAGYEVLSGPLSDFVEPAARLCTQLQRKYGEGDSGLEKRREYMSVLSDSADDLSFVTLLRGGGRDLGISISFIHESTLYLRQLGFDYEHTGKAFEYFFLTFYHPVEFAIEQGLTRIDLGLGSYRAKLLRGAHVDPLYGYARSKTGGSPMEDGLFKERSRIRAEILARSLPDELESDAFR